MLVKWWAASTFLFCIQFLSAESPGNSLPVSLESFMAPSARQGVLAKPRSSSIRYSAIYPLSLARHVWRECDGCRNSLNCMKEEARHTYGYGYLRLGQIHQRHKPLRWGLFCPWACPGTKAQESSQENGKARKKACQGPSLESTMWVYADSSKLQPIWGLGAGWPVNLSVEKLQSFSSPDLPLRTCLWLPVLLLGILSSSCWKLDFSVKKWYPLTYHFLQRALLYHPELLIMFHFQSF